MVKKCMYCGANLPSEFMIMCPECQVKHREETLKRIDSKVRGYFICCPLCGNNEIKANYILGGRHTLTCENCGAQWHLHIGLRGFRWAELDVESKDGKGLELLGKRLEKDEWRKMALEIRKTLPHIPLPHMPMSHREEIKKEKDVEGKTVIIKEREIIKIRCPYCHRLYEETENKCPHCGGTH